MRKITHTLFKLVTAMAVAVALPALAADRIAAKTVVFVHGALADGSSWNKVIPLLQEKGLKTISVQNPLTSLADDVDFTQRALEQAEAPIVLVGHSWGGVVITEAGNSDKVSSLVYVSALAPSAGESLHDCVTRRKESPRVCQTDC